MTEQDDPNAASRKQDHIELAFASQVSGPELDLRFQYEPLLAPHPTPDSLAAVPFLGKKLRVPIWVSSMTGGTQLARIINRNLARACREFGMGMGLGSCRSLLTSDDHLDDFAVRDLIGRELPLFANLGIAQIEQQLDRRDLDPIRRLLDKTEADGLIVHVNPLQEWLQPEGDRFRRAPIDVIEQLLHELDAIPVIVKEVGQGMGYESLKALFQLPLAAVDFAANGGTNFARLELLRSNAQRKASYEALALIGHTATDMVAMTNRLTAELADDLRCRQVIISGGVRDFLDGYYLTQKCKLPAVYGQASGFLRHARGDYQELQTYVAAQVRGLELASAYLRLR